MVVPGGLITPIIRPAPVAAAFPSIVQTSTYAGARGAGPNHPVPWMTGMGSSNLMIACAASEVYTDTFTWPAAFTVFHNKSSTDNPLTEFAWYEPDGTETGTFTLTISGGLKKVSVCMYEISGAADPNTTPPEASTPAEGTSTNADPSSLTPSGGSKKYLWIATAAWWGSASCSAPPSGYSNHLTAQVLAGAGDTMMTTGTYQNEAATEDPGTFTNGSSTWDANTVAVFPA